MKKVNISNQNIIMYNNYIKWFQHDVILGRNGELSKMTVQKLPVITTMAK